VTPLQVFPPAPNPPRSAGNLGKLHGCAERLFVWQCRDGITKPGDSTSRPRRTCAACGYGNRFRNKRRGPDSLTRAGVHRDADGATVAPDAVMLTAPRYSYNARTSLPLTQTNLAAYPVTMSTVGTPPLTAGNAERVRWPDRHCPERPEGCGRLHRSSGDRRDARCNKCHQELGTFTEDAFPCGSA